MKSSPATGNPVSIASLALNDLRHYLSSIEPVVYQTPLDLLSGSTIGQHTRHIIEFYTCLLDQSKDGDSSIINYALRNRDHRIEAEPDHALNCVDGICDKLKDLDVSVECKLDCSEHGQDNLTVHTTFGRELIYNIEHTIHHLAIIKIALRSVMPELSLPEHFGVAPSTIRHRQEACAQ